MRLLLDTCAILWSALDPEKLSPAATAALLDPASELFVASISVAEVACACDRGRVQLATHWKPWFRRALTINGWTSLAATHEIMEEAYSLPDVLHPDPADRIIVATARVHGLALVTGDRLLLAYPHVDTVW